MTAPEMPPASTSRAPLPQARRLPVRAALTAVGAQLVASILWVLLAPLVVEVPWSRWLLLVVQVVPIHAVTLAATAAAVALWLRPLRAALVALVLAPETVELGDLRSLHLVPRRVALVAASLGITGALAKLDPIVEFVELDSAERLALCALELALLLATALPLWASLYDGAQSVLELAPPGLAAALLEAETPRTARRTAAGVIVSLAAPIALVGAGGALAMSAHVHTAEMQERAQTARTVLQSLEAHRELASRGLLFEPTSPVARGVGRALGERGYGTEGLGATSVGVRAASAWTVRGELGRSVVRIAPAPTPVSVVGLLAAAVLSGVVVASAVGLWLAALLVGDLRLAAGGLRELGARHVGRSARAVARRARLDAVQDLGAAIAELADRFDLYADAHRRAVGVREAAQRLRGLLFASVSHDLKSPLAGILGLCDLLEQEALLPEQRESLGLVKSRGRELLALIETILDATRVESGQLELLVRQGSLAELVDAATTKARDLTSDAACALRVHMPSELPDELRYDALHLPRALGAILGYALRVTSATAEPRVELSCSAASGWLVLTVEFGGPTSSELGDLLEREQASRGRGLTLGLSLARKIIELHGGEARVHAGGGARPRCVVRLPLALVDRGQMP